MSQITWEQCIYEDFINGGSREYWIGTLGKNEHPVCQIFPFEVEGVEFSNLKLTSGFPASTDVPGSASGALTFVAASNAMIFAEQVLAAWVDRAGLMPKPGVAA